MPSSRRPVGRPSWPMSRGRRRNINWPKRKLRSEFSGATTSRPPFSPLPPHPNNHDLVLVVLAVEAKVEEESEAVVDAQPGRGRGTEGTLSQRQFALFSAGGRPALEADEQRLAKA
ncbi:hypothetical protein V8C43DRAFT_306770 [Trichoderma afarasin]